MRIHWLLPFLWLLMSCGSPDEHDSGTSSLVYTNAYGRWPNPRLIPVCTVNPGDVGPVLWGDVVYHVKREFASRAGIGFVGFGPCSAADFQNPVIRVYFARTHDWSVPNTGLAGGGYSNVGRSPSDCGPTCAGGTMRLDIGRNGEYPPGNPAWILTHTRATAIHEFGHALGLWHEQDRTDASGCHYPSGSIPAGGDNVYVGPYDPNSIMNYCKPFGQIGLSDGDVRGLEFLYPMTTQLGNSVSIHVESSGKCVDIEGFTFDPAGKIQQWDCNGGQRNQLWRFRDVGGGLFEVRSSSTDLCLDVANESRENGAKIVQWFCRGSDNQKVRLHDRGNGRYALQFVHSGRCLDVDGGRPDNGIQLQQWDCYWNTAQAFYVQNHG